MGGTNSYDCPLPALADNCLGTEGQTSYAYGTDGPWLECVATTPSPPPADVAGSDGDPHLHFAHGGKADARVESVVPRAWCHSSPPQPPQAYARALFALPTLEWDGLGRPSRGMAWATPSCQWERPRTAAERSVAARARARMVPTTVLPPFITCRPTSVGGTTPSTLCSPRRACASAPAPRIPTSGSPRCCSSTVRFSPTPFG